MRVPKISRTRCETPAFLERYVRFGQCSRGTLSLLFSNSPSSVWSPLRKSDCKSLCSMPCSLKRVMFLPNRYRSFAFLLALTLASSGARAQKELIPRQPPATTEYTLGPGDQVNIRVVDLEEFTDKSVRIDPNGFVDLPMVGRIQASGLTIDQFKDTLSTKLSRYINSPQITLNLAENQNQTVSVLGSVSNPGILPMAGPRRLTDVLSLAGGTKPDAGSRVIVTRQMKWGALPVTGAKVDGTGNFSTVSLPLDDLLNSVTPSENIYVRPGDVISIPKAEIIYVVGDVKKAGGFTLSSHPTLSILQALSLAEGLDHDSSPSHAKIIRPIPGGDGKPNEIPVDISKILAGQNPDVPLFANDILFVPNSALKSGSRRAAEAALQVATGLVIYRR